MSNYDVVTAALAGKTMDRKSMNMGTVAGNDWYGARLNYYGALPTRLKKILDRRRRDGKIRQVIYSYSTPIAWLDGDVWIVPDVTYSITTTKHQSELWRLNNRRGVPWDAGMDEYLQVLKGATRYIPNYRDRAVGSYVAA